MNIRTVLAIVALAIGGAAEAVEVIFAGDSTMAPMRYVYSSEASTRGSWVDETDDYFPNWKNHILNYAADGQTMASFVASGNYEMMLREVKKGDFAFLAFADVTEKQMEDFVAAVRERKGVPMLGTTAMPEEGERVKGERVKGEVVRRTAERLGVDFVDVKALAGDKASAKPTLAEARALARAFVADCRKRGLKLGAEYIDGEPAKIGRRRWDRRQTIVRRLQLMGGVKAGELSLRPTYTSLGFRLGVKPGAPAVQALYRRKGEDTWRESKFPPPYFEETAEYRGSITGLEEDTEYEVRIGGKNATFRTWKTAVKVARTIEIPADAKFPYVISEKGTADGWVRYTVAPGVTLRRDRTDHILLVKDAAYVLIENIRFDGGGGEDHEPIHIVGSEGVRIRNCEFTGWGLAGTPDFSDRAWAKDEKGSLINCNAAISIGQKSKCVTVERCYFHDAFGTSNSWFYSHPAGNEGIVMGRPDHSTVIRYNDFIGGDRHWFNDAVEGRGNFWEDGGFNCDADVYGNFMVFCNDDNIELDGGQMNVRCFGNRFESSLVGVSVQGCMVSPSYVFDNEFTGLGEEHGKCGAFVKPWGFDIYHRHPTTYIYENRFQGPGLVASPVQFAPNGFVGGNVRDAESLNVCRVDGTYPKRDLPFVLDQGRLNGFEVRGGRSAAPTRIVKMKWCGAAGGERVSFEIRQNAEADWFEVTSSASSIGPGEAVDLKVTILPERMNDRRRYRAAFLVRTADGLSRVCSLYAATDYTPPFEAVPAGEHAVYLDARTPVEGQPKIVADPRSTKGEVVLLPLAAKESPQPLKYVFDIPKKGRWWFYLRGTTTQPTDALVEEPATARITVSVNGEPKKVSLQQCKSWMTWTMITPGRNQGNMISYWDLEPGKHEVVIDPVAAGWCPFRFEALVATDTPGSFEPR